MGWIEDIGNAIFSTHDVTSEVGGLKQLGFNIFRVSYVLGIMTVCAYLANMYLQMDDVGGWIGAFIGLIIGIFSASVAYKLMQFILIVGIICGAIYVIYSVI